MDTYHFGTTTEFTITDLLLRALKEYSGHCAKHPF